MKTTLNSEGQIRIPDEVQQADHLHVGDSFDLERLHPGCYLLSRQDQASFQYEVVTAEDGLPVVRVQGPTLTSQKVKELESQTA